MDFALGILICSGAFYAVAFVIHMFSFFSSKSDKHSRAFFVMRLGFLLNTFYFAVEAVNSQLFIPVSSLSEALAFFAWSLSFVYLVLLVRAQSDSFGLILSPILSFLILGASLAFRIASKDYTPPTNPLFMVHIVSAFFAYASFTISFAAGILFLIQNHELKAKRAGTFYHKLPSLEELEKLIYQPMLWGAALLSLAVVIGLIWSKSAYGESWILDPKTIFTTIAAFAYIIILGLRFTDVLRTKQGAILSLAAFFLVFLSFVGPRFIEGSHNYLR